jgi:large subunit ribosomal protein L3
MAKQQKGILGEKLGMTQVWDESNKLVPVTVVKAGPCVVTQVRTPDKDGYDAVQIAFGAIDPRKVNKPLAGHFAKAGVPPRRHVTEIRTSDASTYTVGQELTAELFEGGALVDVIGVSKGHGFSGVMKRHGFAGLGAGHGVQRKHRSPGSIGACATPSRVFKGVRMAGQYGNVRTTTLNLTVHSVDAERGLLLIKGAVPGPNGGTVVVRTAAKAPAVRGVRGLTG